MKSTDIPPLWATLWANNPDAGTVSVIPANDPGGGHASLTKGFSKTNMTPRADGGIPPFGADMNGALQRLSQGVQRCETGITRTFDATYAKTIGGYPKGTQLQSATDPTVVFISLKDDNLVDPASGDATSWARIGGTGKGDAVFRFVEGDLIEVYFEKNYESGSGVLITENYPMPEGLTFKTPPQIDLITYHDSRWNNPWGPNGRLITSDDNATLMEIHPDKFVFKSWHDYSSNGSARCCVTIRGYLASA